MRKLVERSRAAEVPEARERVPLPFVALAAGPVGDALNFSPVPCPQYMRVPCFGAAGSYGYTSPFPNGDAA
jgi:hypothetical protein